MFTELEIVERCLLMFSKPGRWAQRTLAPDRKGKPVPVFSDEAPAFDIRSDVHRAGDRRALLADFPQAWALGTANARTGPERQAGPRIQRRGTGLRHQIGCSPSGRSSSAAC